MTSRDFLWSGYCVAVIVIGLNKLVLGAGEGSLGL